MNSGEREMCSDEKVIATSNLGNGAKLRVAVRRSRAIHSADLTVEAQPDIDVLLDETLLEQGVDVTSPGYHNARFVGRGVAQKVIEHFMKAEQGE